MLKKLSAFFLMITLFSTVSLTYARAETPFQAAQFPYKDMQIQVMPEFDYPDNWPKNTPSLLVGLYGTITNKTGRDYDGKVELPVPSKEKNFQLYLVAEFPETNKPEVQRPYDVDNEKEVVSWKPAAPIKNNQTYRFVIEYYVNSINVKDQKSFTYKFANQSDIETLDVIFYAPMNAQNINLEPNAQNNAKNEYGEELFYYQYKNVKKGNSLNYSFTYKKDDNNSTLTAINNQEKQNKTSKKNGSDTDQAINGSGERPIITLGGASIIGFAIIVAGMFVFFGLKGGPNSQKGSSKAKRKSKNAASRKQGGKRETKTSQTDEKKELRKRLLNGKIDQETYEEEMKKLI